MSDMAPGSRDRPFGVSEINARAREQLEQEFPEVWIKGEISNFKAHGSGHHYFSLKDSRAQINSVMFRSANSLLRFKPEDGQAVLARGRITLYEPRGSYQINVGWMEEVGVGSLQQAFEELKARLQAEGLFAAERKRPIPALPRRVGLVTSPEGAAVRDILRVLERRAAGLDVLIAPCSVQGRTAAPMIVAAIRKLNTIQGIDVMIVTRGGGSMEDLQAFNEEAVARSIAASEIPVISAVGHEVDFTISDFVADLRAPTPSAAAEMVIKSREELAGRVSSLRTQLLQAARITVLKRRGLVRELASSRAFARVESSLSEARQRCDEAAASILALVEGGLRELFERLQLARERLSPRSLKAEVVSRRERLTSAGEMLQVVAAMRVRSLRDHVGAMSSLLGSLSPLGVLDRGYAICQKDAGGTVVTSSNQVTSGEGVTVRLAKGRIGAMVVWTRTGNGRSER